MTHETAAPEDVESVDAIITALYALISGPAGTRDWDRLRTLYVDGARLIPTGDRPNGESGLQVLDVEGFIRSASAFFAENGFYEREIHRKTERFGNVVHAMSTYETYRSESDAEPFMRGVNSIQLLHKDGRWWVVTIFWDNESPENPIPAEYLPS